MARIALTSGFSRIPEGHYVFCITEVEYKEAFGKLNLTMMTEDGQKHVEKYSLIKNNGEANDGAYNAFSFLAHTALNDFDIMEIDHEDLIGHFIECDVEHETVPSTKDPNKTYTNVRLNNLQPSDGWGTVEETGAGAEENTETTEEVPAFDLNSWLK